MRNNSPQMLLELRNWMYQILQKWDVRAMKALHPQVPIPSSMQSRAPLPSPIQETRILAGETEPQMWGNQQQKSQGEINPENKKIKLKSISLKVRSYLLFSQNAKPVYAISKQEIEKSRENELRYGHMGISAKSRPSTCSPPLVCAELCMLYSCV